MERPPIGLTAVLQIIEQLTGIFVAVQNNEIVSGPAPSGAPHQATGSRQTIRVDFAPPWLGLVMVH